MYVLGVDIGSTTAKAVIMDEKGSVLAKDIIPTGVWVDKAIDKVRANVCQKAGIDPKDIEYCVSTGYGRLRVPYMDAQVTEITCHARGLHSVMPDVKTVIDIGGQDSKVISLDENGSILNFVMNDQCAAGTGRFIDVMSRIMDIPIEEVGDFALRGTEPAAISSVCTVFAESEVISKASSGVSPENIMAGIHLSIARRLKGLVGQHNVPPVAMTGGLAQNKGLVAALEKILNCKITVPDDPQIIGALGAAIIARERMMEE